MTLELSLLLLESVLLVATVILLIYSIHEGKRRDQLLKEVGKFTKVANAKGAGSRTGQSPIPETYFQGIQVSP